MQLLLLILTLFCLQSCTIINTLDKNYRKKEIATFIDNHIQKTKLNMLLSMKVASLSTGQTLYEKNSAKLLIPASTVKLFTSAASLYYLDSQHIFKTVIAKKKNNIILHGGADPGLSTKNLDSLANIVAIKMANIDTLFIDDGILDSINYGKGWTWDEGSEQYSAPIGGLTLNGNCIDFLCSPSSPGQSVKIKLLPETGYVSFTNNSLTVLDTLNNKKLTIDRDWLNQTNHFQITGTIIEGNYIDTVKKNIYNPTQYTGLVFKELLKSRGFNIKKLQMKNFNEKTDTLAKHDSEPLLKHLKQMMYKSDNLTSELVIKYISANDTTKGNWDDGIDSVKMFLSEKVKIDTNSIRIADGSGLSRYNLISTNQVVELLKYMNDTELKNKYKSILPSGNTKDTGLHRRLRKNSKRINAKTGTLSGVSCLSGYINSPKYGPLAFSIIINGFVGSVEPYRKFQDDICSWLIQD